MSRSQRQMRPGDHHGTSALLPQPVRARLPQTWPGIIRRVGHRLLVPVSQTVGDHAANDVGPGPREVADRIDAQRGSGPLEQVGHERVVLRPGELPVHLVPGQQGPTPVGRDAHARGLAAALGKHGAQGPRRRPAVAGGREVAVLPVLRAQVVLPEHDRPERLVGDHDAARARCPWRLRNLRHVDDLLQVV